HAGSTDVVMGGRRGSRGLAVDVHERLRCEHGDSPQAPQTQAEQDRQGAPHAGHEDRAGNARPCPRHGPRRGPYRPHSAARESDGRVRGRVPAWMTKLLLDTNLYVGWLNHGLHEALIVGPGFVLYLSSVVQMELRVGAATRPGRRLLAQLIPAHSTRARLLPPPWP